MDSPDKQSRVKSEGIPADELKQRIRKLKEEVMNGEIESKFSRERSRDNNLDHKLKKAEALNKKAQEHIEKLSWDNAILEKQLKDSQKQVTKLENQLKNSEDLRKMLEIELEQHRTIDKGLETLRARMSQQANEMESTKVELKKANARAKQVESAALKIRDDTIEDCKSCQSKVDSIRELNKMLKERDEQIARMKVTHERHAAEMAEKQGHSKCDCRYKVMEAKAEIETHMAAGEKLRAEREKYESMFHQYAKERQSVMDRLKDCEGKLEEKEEKIRKLRQENKNNNCANKYINRNRGGLGGDCRVVGAMKDTVEDLTQDLRAKEDEIKQLHILIGKLDVQLRETAEQAMLAKNENSQLATEMMKRLHEYEACLNERDALIQENARLKVDMVAMVPKLDAKSPRKASAIAEFDRLTEKLQDTEKQLIECRKELQKSIDENKKKSDKLLLRKNLNNTNKNETKKDEGKRHSGKHRNCLTCRLLNKLQMGLSNCSKCKDDTKPCQCERYGKLPASIRSEIEDYEVPWPRGSKDWKEVEKRSEKKVGPSGRERGEQKGRTGEGGRKYGQEGRGGRDRARSEATETGSPITPMQKNQSKVSFAATQTNSGENVEEVSGIEGDKSLDKDFSVA